jgi:hypothetical protein
MLRLHTAMPASTRKSCNSFNAAKVACTTLRILSLPSDLLRMSLMPAASTTARTPPPAMTPVPGLAGLSITLPAPNLACDLVRDGVAQPRHRHHRLLGAVRRLADGVRHFARLADADADASLLVAHHDHSAEGKAATTLHNLGSAGKMDNAFVELVAALFALFLALFALSFFLRHS